MAKGSVRPAERRRRRLGRRLRIGLVALAVLAAAFAVFRLSAMFAPIDADDLQRGPGRLVRFADREGHFVGAVLANGDSACQPVELAEVDEVLVHAFIAAEDERFYRHGGVDYTAMARAAWQNLRRGRVVSGGSTITMQLARLLQPKERSSLNKLREMHAAWRLEAGMSKGEILEAYLNRVPMGGNLVGVGVASRVFFGREPSELALTQAALLAAIPRDPVRNDPRSGLEHVEERRSYVLRRMAEVGYVTEEEAELSRKSRASIASGEDPLSAYQLFFHAIARAPEDASSIRLTLDSDVQRMAAEQVRVVAGRLADSGVTNAAAIVLDNRSGEVLAYVGSASFFDTEHSGQVDGVQAARQPGSTLKPFVYALALERGFMPATVLPDVPTRYPMKPGQQYEPDNYSKVFNGPVLLRSALANSYNVPACHVAAEIGVPSVLEQLHRFGFESLDRSADYYGLGVVLGGGEVTLYELARAYMALANSGKLAEPIELLQVDATGVGPPDAVAQVCRPMTSYLLGDILSDRNARAPAFGSRSALDLPFPCAAKTGTSSGYRDNWAVGYTDDYTVAAWVGNFDAEEMRDVSGITGAGPLFARIMYHLYPDGRWPERHPRPAGVVRRPICSLSGMRPSQYCPHVREELFLEAEADRADLCDWHRPEGAGGVRAVIPEEFRVESAH